MKLLLVEEYAKIKRLSRDTVHKHIQNGRIPRQYVHVVAGKFGKRGAKYRIDAEALNADKAPPIEDNDQRQKRVRRLHENAMAYLEEVVGL